MNRLSRIAIIFLLLAFVGISPAVSPQADDDNQGIAKTSIKKAPEKAANRQPPQYTPPAGARPTPRVRTGKGGTRSAGMEFPAFVLLTPEHEAITYNAQPSFYWRLDQAHPHGVIFELTDTINFSLENNISQRIPGPVPTGIQEISLNHLNGALKDGIKYEWSIELCRDKQCSDRSKNPKAHALVIKKTDAPESHHNNDWYELLHISMKNNNSSGLLEAIGVAYKRLKPDMEMER